MNAGHPEPIRIVNWNLQWAPRSRRERIARRLAELAPEILCATEADREILPRGGHVAECRPDSGYGANGGRRKVILWSRWPMEEIDPVGEETMPPGRFVAATCRSPLGPLRLVGACIPWSHANVSTGRHKGRAPWDDHLAYLVGLEQLVAGRDPAMPMFVIGDFNQRIPRSRAPVHVATALTNALGDLVVATACDLPGIDRRVIDHVAHTRSLTVCDVEGFDRHDADGRPLSDHDGVRCVLVPGAA